MKRRPALGAFLALSLLPLLCASAAHADKVIIRYSDGTEQAIDLMKPYDSVEVVREAPPPPPKPPESFISIGVDAATRGQTVDLNYSVIEPLYETAWLGVIPSDVPHGDGYENDRYDVLFVYLKGSAKNRIRIAIPANIPSGEYEIRIFDSDQNGKEVASSPPFYVY
jgi:hypothetical protein